MLCLAGLGCSRGRPSSARGRVLSSRWSAGRVPPLLSAVPGPFFICRCYAGFFRRISGLVSGACRAFRCYGETAEVLEITGDITGGCFRHNRGGTAEVIFPVMSKSLAGFRVAGPPLAAPDRMGFESDPCGPAPNRDHKATKRGMLAPKCGDSAELLRMRLANAMLCC